MGGFVVETQVLPFQPSFFSYFFSYFYLLALAFRILYSACQKVGFGVAQQDGAPNRDGSRALREDSRTN